MPRFRLTFLDDPPAAVSLLAQRQSGRCGSVTFLGTACIHIFLLPLASIAVPKLPRTARFNDDCHLDNRIVPVTSPSQDETQILPDVYHHLTG
jgi:hypothetical protein